MNLLDHIRNVEIVEDLYDTGHDAFTPRLVYLSEHSARKIAAAVAEAMREAGFLTFDGLGESALDWVMKQAEPPEPDAHAQQLRFPVLDDFDGSTFEAEHDQQRLGNQLRRVLQVLLVGEPLTLAEIRERTGDPEASISARIRDLRKPKFGAHTVHSLRRGDPKSGVWEYRLEARP